MTNALLSAPLLLGCGAFLSTDDLEMVQVAVRCLGVLAGGGALLGVLGLARVALRPTTGSAGKEA